MRAAVEQEISPKKSPVRAVSSTMRSPVSLRE